MPTFNKPEDADNGLQVLLLRAVPKNKHGNKTLTELARLMHLSRWALQKWINNEKVSPERVKQILDISQIVGWNDDGEPIKGKARVKIEDFHQYVYKD